MSAEKGFSFVCNLGFQHTNAWLSTYEGLWTMREVTVDDTGNTF